MPAMLLELRGLTRDFPVAGGKTLHAVADVDLAVDSGTALGLVGESGCGKSTLGRLVVRLLDASDGRIFFDGHDIGGFNPGQLRDYRRAAQFVFQDPHSALNPRMTIFRAVAEPLVLHTKLRGKALRQEVATLLKLVGLPEQFLERYPHELSGGQKQRVCIARAIALKPKLIVLDEPTSALDVSVQAQILEVLKDLQRKFGLAYLFISHNLAVIRAVCPRVAVMYLGRIVEEGPTEEVFARPRHPYAAALIDAIPVPEGRQPERTVRLEGDIPSAIDLPAGCVFASRCPKKIAGRCETEAPRRVEIAPGHRVACHLYETP
jgi:peptide/nickel transport system ATP-binding protein/oligopeptide transport system ATP-binding protein